VFKEDKPLRSKTEDPQKDATDPEPIPEEVKTISTAPQPETPSVPEIPIEEDKTSSVQSSETPRRMRGRATTGGPNTKLMICGAHGSGKTSFVNRWIDGEFSMDVKPSTGCPFRSNTLTSETNENLKIQIYEAPKDKFKMHARNAIGIIFTYDVTEPGSLTFLGELIDVFKNTPHRENCMIYALGNKADREDRSVNESDVNELFEGLNAQFFEASQLTGKGCEDLYQAIEEAAFS
jgi:GTPase SAR1 family protein